MIIRGARHGGIYVDLGNYFLYPFGGYGIIGLHAGLYGGIRYVVGPGLLRCCWPRSSQTRFAPR